MIFVQSKVEVWKDQNSECPHFCIYNLFSTDVTTMLNLLRGGHIEKRLF